MNNNHYSQNSDLPASQKNKIQLLDSVVILILLLSMFFTGCQKDEDFTKSLPACPSGAVFKVSPVAPEDIIRFEPLGHYRPSGHVFPTSHHYIDVIRGAGSVPLYAPCDGWVTFVAEYQLAPPHNVEYALEMWACKEIMVKFGHVARLDQSILDQLGNATSSYSYSTGGSNYNFKTLNHKLK